MDNDSTGVMVGCWFGAMHGFLGVPDNHHKKLNTENAWSRLEKKLYKLVYKDKEHQSPNISFHKEDNVKTDECNDP